MHFFAHGLMKNNFLDRAAWQDMLNREQTPDTSGCVGLLRRSDFASRQGTLLVWCGKAGGMEADFRAYDGSAGSDVDLLLVADDDALQALRTQGLAALRSMVRSGRLHPYMLKTMDELESAGLADFVEDMGLTFPKH